MKAAGGKATAAAAGGAQLGCSWAAALCAQGAAAAAVLGGQQVAQAAVAARGLTDQLIICSCHLWSLIRLKRVACMCVQLLLLFGRQVCAHV
jgi:hypothetical protein